MNRSLSSQHAGVRVFAAMMSIGVSWSVLAAEPAVLIQAAVTALLTPLVFRITGWAARMAGLRMSNASR